MRKNCSGVAFAILVSAFALSGLWAADGLQGQLDYPHQRIAMNQATPLEATLTNNSTSFLYLNGITVDISHNASAGLYNPDLLQAQLRSLGPKQSWDGPLIVITPAHRGPLSVEGAVTIQGGAAPTSTGTLTAIAVSVPIDDPRRNADGSLLRGTPAVCDRPPAACCAGEEAFCFPKGEHCIYKAEGFNQERVCRDRVGQAAFDHVLELQVSSDGTHTAYIAGDRCSTNGVDEICRRRIMLDNIPQPTTGMPTQLVLSPTGSRSFWVERETCVNHLGQDVCTGTAQVVLDRKAGPRFAVVDGIAFSPDSRHLVYRGGTYCRRSPPKADRRALLCGKAVLVVDEVQGAPSPAWYSSATTPRLFRAE